MPTYEYQCQCGHSFEEEQRISEPALKTCPICKDSKCKNWKKNKGCKVERVINATGFVLKGGGWYKDGYGSSKSSSESSTKKPKTQESSSSTTKTESVSQTASKKSADSSSNSK